MYLFDFTSTGVYHLHHLHHFNCAMICIAIFIKFIIQLINGDILMCTHVHIQVMYLQILFFKVLIKLSAITDFPSLYVEYISMSFFLTMISFIYDKIRYLY